MRINNKIECLGLFIGHYRRPDGFNGSTVRTALSLFEGRIIENYVGHFHGQSHQPEAVSFKLVHDPEDLTWGEFRGKYNHYTDETGVRQYRGIVKIGEHNED